MNQPELENTKNNYRKTCLDCRRPVSSCMCTHLSPIETRTRFVILMHPLEYRKIKNGTGRLTHLQLTNSEVIVGVDFTENKRVNELLKTHNPLLLYPGDDAYNVSKGEYPIHEKPNCIFILDGTWPCAKKMIKLSKNLKTLPKVSFDSSIESKFKIKQQPLANCLSTIESVQVLLEEMAKHQKEDIPKNNLSAFLKPFEKMVEYQINCTLDPSRSKYRSGTVAGIKPKTNYKKNPVVRVFYSGYDS